MAAQSSPRKIGTILVAGAIVVGAMVTAGLIWQFARPEPSQKGIPEPIAPQEAPDVVAEISREQVAKLPAESTIRDIERLIGKANMFSDSPIFTCPAREGGAYLFSFFPTNEVPRGKDQPDNAFNCVAIVHFDATEGPRHDLGTKPGGRYVFPPSVAGQKFTGFKMEPEK